MLETAAQLREQKHSVPAFDAVVDRSLPWGEKLQAFAEGLQSLNGGTTFLLCNPHDWRSGQDDDFYWNAKTRQLCASLFQNGPKLVYTGYCMDGLPGASKHRLGPDFGVRTFLECSFQGGPLSRSAKSIARGCSAPSQLDESRVRLLVAVRHVTGRPQRPTQSRAELLRVFRDALKGDAWAALRDAWRTLSLVRRPFHWDALRSILPQTLSAEQEAILTQCLMQAYQDGRCELAVRPDWYSPTWRPQQAHASCFSLYGRRLGGAGETNRWRFDLEAGHHASAAGHWDYLERRPPLFGDQYNLFGKRASLAAKESADEELFTLAAHFFEQTLAVDDQDDYAHHYLAYNLDYAALDEARADEHYRRAIEIDSQRPWWHSRYVSFLITTGRAQDARQAWAAALDDLLSVKQTDENRVYEDFHRWVLRLLLHRSQLDFASEVLQDIPESHREGIRGIRLMEGMLASMADAAEGRDVYPMDVPLRERWTAPRLLVPPETDRPRTRWFVGKIEYKTDQAVGLLLAEKPADTDEPSYFRSELTLARFDDLSETKVSAVREGDYFEFYTFAPTDEAGEEEGLIRFARQDPRSAWTDLPPLKPDPRRYLRRAGWIGGDSGQASPA